MRCLIVDDSKVVRKITRGFLEPLGFTVDEAEDGTCAQTWINEHGMPDLIMLDWNMPNMNGIDFLRWLRSVPEGGDTPNVIFCTTENSFDYIQNALMAGANEYVMKPFDKEILIGKLEILGLA
ncbi:MAG: response regulator [Alphaproteobacteria bacterium]|nr:MAG: response regulator [Alphaproteobacteria bacterium]TAF13397.1 MAG: response regulator [Alphaproteobacteria bacterium]TAF41880.1 MAG: response regulator [Alphaproteobacteria bacterium]TAF77213.1 MAG: response regulator [Alphaproteobacteria bacterium]